MIVRPVGPGHSTTALCGVRRSDVLETWSFGKTACASADLTGNTTGHTKKDGGSAQFPHDRYDRKRVRKCRVAPVIYSRHANRETSSGESELRVHNSSAAVCQRKNLHRGVATSHS